MPRGGAPTTPKWRRKPTQKQRRARRAAATGGAAGGGGGGGGQEAARLHEAAAARDAPAGGGAGGVGGSTGAGARGGEEAVYVRAAEQRAGRALLLVAARGRLSRPPERASGDGLGLTAARLGDVEATSVATRTRGATAKRWRRAPRTSASIWSPPKGRRIGAVDAPRRQLGRWWHTTFGPSSRLLTRAADYGIGMARRWGRRRCRIDAAAAPRRAGRRGTPTRGVESGIRGRRLLGDGVPRRARAARRRPPHVDDVAGANRAGIGASSSPTTIHAAEPASTTTTTTRSSRISRGSPRCLIPQFTGKIRRTWRRGLS